jgi:hypothetical protein
MALTFGKQFNSGSRVPRQRKFVAEILHTLVPGGYYQKINTSLPEIVSFWLSSCLGARIILLRDVPDNAPNT